tara:strand:- start:93 stop:311 length:219 start_codon:yes stop_codon:yes gene_type:complete
MKNYNYFKRKKTILIATALLIVISLMYRYTERYDYGGDEKKEVLKKNEAITQKVKDRNITQADLDEMMKLVR